MTPARPALHPGQGLLARLMLPPSARCGEGLCSEPATIGGYCAGHQWRRPGSELLQEEQQERRVQVTRKRTSRTTGPTSSVWGAANEEGCALDKPRSPVSRTTVVIAQLHRRDKMAATGAWSCGCPCCVTVRAEMPETKGASA